MTGQVLRELTAQELLERLGSVPDDVEPVPAPSVSARRWALRRAAVLRGFFRLDDLPPAALATASAVDGDAKDGGTDEDQVMFVREDCERARTPRGGRWQLAPEVRRATVEHLQYRRDRLLDTLTGVPDDPLDVGMTMARAYLRGDAPPLAKQTLDQLTGTRLAVEWLAGVRTDLPDVTDVDAAARLTTLLTPLRSVLNTPVRGRDQELERLRAFTDRPGDGRFVPLVISGAGGMGKTALLATFVVQRHEDAPVSLPAPFAYLTFDRADLAPQMPLTVLAEVLRQLAVQVPGQGARMTQVADQLEQTQVNVSAAERDAQRVRGTVDVWRRWERDVDVLLRDAARVTSDTIGAPVVCVLDTFERAQRQGPGPVGRLWDLLGRVTSVLPKLRVIVAGRGGVPDHEIEVLELGGLPDDAARAVLRDRLRGHSAPGPLLDVVVRRSRGNPLTLRLAAELMRRQHTSLAEPEARRRFLHAFDDEVEVQGVLYRRVLDHVDAPEAQALAIPGLVLRRLTIDLVRDVLARAAGLGRITTAEASHLYEVLRAESSLVTEQDGVLVHRQDVRAQVLPIIVRDQPRLVGSVHRRAVAFYRARTGLADRTEELYHRLALGQRPRTLENRWDDGAGVPLYPVLQEELLKPQVHVWLANKLGLTVDEELLRQVDDAAWLQQAVRAGRNLLDAGRPAEALDVLQARRTEPPDLTLTELEVEALARTGRRQEAVDLAVLATAVAEDRRDDAATGRFLGLAAQLAEDDGDFGRALELLTQARRYALQRDDVVQATALGAGNLRLLRRQDRADDDTTAELRADVVRLARSLTHKQRTSSPALVRDLAAEIGQDAPEFVLEAANTVGIDVTSAQARVNLSAHSKQDVGERIRQILDTDEARHALPDTADEILEFTSHAQGQAIGSYLEATSDEASSSALSEYFQVESDARSFGVE